MWQPAQVKARSGRANALANHVDELMAELRAVAERGWRELEGGPTSAWAAGCIGYTPRGLRKALHRAGARWTDIKDSARPQCDIGPSDGAAAA